ncbi:MAG: hypothetical protein ACRYF0_03195 [Janthinobacterium lividum]
MLRSLIKLGTLVGGLTVVLSPSLPARAQNPTTAVTTTNVPVPDVRAHVWAATARYVYNDDPALASLRPRLLSTIDSGSVKAFGHRLEDAVKLEQRTLPKQGHLLKFLELFKTASTREEPPAQLATSITTTLLANKPERRTQARFVQLGNTLRTLANPGTSVATPVTAVAPVAAPGDSAVAVPAPLPAPASVTTITPTSSTPMLLTYLALGLSVISLLVSLLKGRSSRGGHRHHSHSAPTLTSFTDEMRTEMRTMIQREVGKLPGARPAPDAPAPPPASVKNTLAKAAAPKPVPAPTAATALAPPAASLPPAEPVAAAPAVAEAPASYPAEPVAAAATRTLYANQQPIDGFFKRDMLAEAPASYSIFELTVTADAPDQAQFVVASNSSGHAGYIGSHQNILGGACEYPFPKGSVSRIVTDAPGQAQRTASGDWQITRKAQVHFE